MIDPIQWSGRANRRASLRPKITASQYPPFITSRLSRRRYNNRNFSINELRDFRSYAALHRRGDDEEWGEACVHYLYPIHSRKAAGYVCLLCMSDKRLRRSPLLPDPPPISSPFLSLSLFLATASTFFRFCPRHLTATIGSYYAPSRLNKFTTEGLIAFS